jgi:hypothetical protein
MESANTLTLSVNVEHDGHYWTASCPALRMTAAHRTKAGAWLRGIRMFSAQIVYALNQDPTLGGLIANDHLGELEQMQKFVREKRGFNLRLQQAGDGISADIPDLLEAIA